MVSETASSCPPDSRRLQALAQFTMDLLTDPNNPDVARYVGSVVWQRRSSFFFGMIKPEDSSFVYNVVQIIDGNGTPIQPAYDEFVANVKNDYGNSISFYGLKPDRLDDYVKCFSWFHSLFPWRSSST